LGVMVIATPATRACSCVDWSPAEHLEHADAAFVGTLISREDEGWGFWGNSGGEVTWTFEVEQAVKGELGDTVDVESPIDDADRGFGAMGAPSRVGLFLNKHDGKWPSGSCSRISPDSLLALVEPFPLPDGSGPVALLVADRLGEVRVMALDRE